MPLLNNTSFAGVVATASCSPLNCIWLGAVERPLRLPQLEHIFLLFPGETAVSCNNSTLHPNQYSLFTAQTEALTLEPIAPDASPTLLLLLSPGFILEMAHFLNIPDSLNHLLHSIPLPQGDELSFLLAELVTVCTPPAQQNTAEELMLEVVGEVLRLMQLRQQALRTLAHHKQSTIDDLLPRLLQARQYVEARYLQPIRVAEVAEIVALSEFHFARLFKTAFDMSLHQFMMRLRLDEARRCLLATNVSVTELGLHVGYSSLSSFIHAFKRRFGVSPSHYQGFRLLTINGS